MSMVWFLSKTTCTSSNARSDAAHAMAGNTGKSASAACASVLGCLRWYAGQMTRVAIFSPEATRCATPFAFCA